jgi:hypothetical protein
LDLKACPAITMLEPAASSSRPADGAARSRAHGRENRRLPPIAGLLGHIMSRDTRGQA